jgi:Pro-kumamolisin, activation domain
MSVRCSLRRLRLAAGLVAAGVAAAFVLPATSAIAAPHGQHGPAAVAQTPVPVRNGSAHKIGPISSAQTIRLTIGLRPPHMAAEKQFLREIQTKSSPLFHHYLTPAGWTARFGPSAAAQQAVVSWARGAGLTVTHLYSNRLVVDLAGRAGTIEKALGVQISTYRLGAKTFFANERDLVLPGALAGVVQSVQGLSDLSAMSPASGGLHEPASRGYVAGPVVAAGRHVAANGSRAKLRAAERASARRMRHHAAQHRGKLHITNGAYDPTDIYSSQAYDYNALYNQGHCCNPLGNAGSSPVQSSIAIATFGSQASSDLVGFHNQYSYLAENIQEVFIDGTPPGGDGEGTMDAEWSTAMSNSFGSFQDTAKVYLYDGASNTDATWTDIYNTMLSQNLARVLSTSWGCAEVFGCSNSATATQDAIFSQMAGQGWTLVAASDDRGSSADCTHLGVSFPASDPNMVAAGGTTLTLSSGPVYDSEVGWSPGPAGCGHNDGGSGGGCSALFSAPSYQSNQPCGSGSRAVPDMALNADWVNTPQNLYFGGSLSGNGGTSIVAPELAGFFAQEDAYLLSEGNICGSGSSACAPFGNANYRIYASALGFSPHYPFYDITSGCNGAYCAGTGWDAVTGWGSANMLQLAWAFNWHLLADDGRPVVTYSGPAINHWYNTDQTVGINVADTGNGPPASGVAGFSDAWNTDPGDPTSEPTPGAGNSFYSGPEFKNATSGSLDLAAEGQGCHTVNVESWDNMGFQSGDATDGPLCYDSVAPAITAAPTVKFQNNVGPVNSTDPVTVSWNGTDATSGINHYTLYQSKDGGAYTQVATPVAKSSVQNITAGHTYQYKVTAADNAGNTSAATAGSSYKLSLVQENSGAIKYSAGWKRQALTGAYGGQVEYANVAGKTATLTIKGTQIAWVSTQGPTRGSASVKLDSGATVTINTHTTSPQTAHIVDVVSGAAGTHTLVVKVLGTSGHPRVDIDAFLVLGIAG